MCGCSLSIADAVACRPDAFPAASNTLLVLWQKLVMHCMTAAVKLTLSIKLRLIIPDSEQHWCHSNSCLYR